MAAATFAEEAEDVARKASARDAETLALALQGAARVNEGDVSRGMSLLDEAVAAAIGGEITDPQWYYLPCCCMIDACDRVRDFRRSPE